MSHMRGSPGRPFLLGSLSLLIGFYLAGSLSTIFGAKGFWEPVIALGPMLVTERVPGANPHSDRNSALCCLSWAHAQAAILPLTQVTKEYYMRRRSERSQTLKLCAGPARLPCPLACRSRVPGGPGVDLDRASFPFLHLLPFTSRVPTPAPATRAPLAHLRRQAQRFEEWVLLGYRARRPKARRVMGELTGGARLPEM